MKIYTYRGEMPNFGDELNNWLLPKVFPNLFDDDDSRLFLGIGSILFDLLQEYEQRFGVPEDDDLQILHRPWFPRPRGVPDKCSI